MEYKDLATLFHMSSSSNREKEILEFLAERKNSPSTFNLDFPVASGELFIAVPRELSSLTQRVLRRERKVSNLIRMLPPIASNEVLRGLVFDEVVMSNQIENIHSTRKQIEAALSVGEGAAPQKKRFKEFAKLYLDLVYGTFQLPGSPVDIREIYDRLMDGESLEFPPDGKLFRKEEAFVVDGIKQIYKGVVPESAIIQGLQKMVDLTASPDVPELYSALASHYIFEYIHPFYDGNGRTGRYLLSMYLEAPLSKPTALSLSRVMAENSDQYYRAFEKVENPLNHGELTFFIMTMLELILKAQDELIDRLEKNVAKLDALAQATDAVSGSGDYSEKVAAILFALLQQRAFGVSSSVELNSLANLLGIGNQQTRKYLAELEKDTAVEKTRGRNPMAFAISDSFLDEFGIDLD